MTIKERKNLTKYYIDERFKMYCHAVSNECDYKVEHAFYLQITSNLELAELLGFITPDESDYVISALLSVKHSHNLTIWNINRNQVVSFQVPNDERSHKHD